MNAWLFLIPIAVGLITQTSKQLLNKNWKSTIAVQGYHLPRYGGMPSAHTAFAVSLATVAWLTEGIASMSFAIAAAMFIFILDDALRMRIYLGHHGQALHKLIAKLPPEEQKDLPALEVRLGHTPAEVLVGTVVGILLTLAISFFVI
jgi:acid phosphatase family membrane protein YuiD